MKNLFSVHESSREERVQYKRSYELINKQKNEMRLANGVAEQSHQGNLMVQCQFREGYQVFLRSSKTKRPLVLSGGAGVARFVLSFTLQSAVLYRLGSGHYLQQKAAQYNIIYKSDADHLYCQDLVADVRILEISFEHSYLKSLLPTFKGPLQDLLEKLEVADSFFYFSRSRFISFEMEQQLLRLQGIMCLDAPGNYLMDYLVTNLLLQALLVGTDPLYEHMPNKFLLERRQQVLDAIKLACSDLHEYYSFDFYAKKSSMSATSLKKFIRKFKGFTLKDH